MENCAALARQPRGEGCALCEGKGRSLRHQEERVQGASKRFGKDRAPPEFAKTLGNYPELGRAAHERIKGSVLVPFPDLRHSRQVQDAARFNEALLEQLARM